MVNIIIIVIFLILIVHYLCTMGNQSIFYSYFQSWEWKETWKDNDLRRIAGEHYSLIKKALINFVLTLGVLSVLLYVLYSYNLLNWHSFSNVIWFRADKLAEYISNAWILNVYWYLLLGYGLFFWGMIICFLVYPKYPSYTFKNTPLFVDRFVLLGLRHISIRNTYILGIFIGICISYTVLNLMPLILDDMKPVSSIAPSNAFFLFLCFLWACLAIYRSKIYWLNIIIISYIAFLIYGWRALYHYTLDIENNIHYLEEPIKFITSILKLLIPSAIIGSIVIVVGCLCTVIISMLKSKKTTESTIYDELSKKMKPCLGFNGRFVSESFIDEKVYSFKELYELTHPKKKVLFWLEYFFSNILNKNVVNLLQGKKLLWLKVLFNGSDANTMKYGDPSEPSMVWSKKDYKKKPIIETMETREKAKFEDPEGDVFTNLLIEEVANTKPSIMLPFYVSGLIYLNVIPYFLIYNVVMLVVFTKFVDIISKMNIELFNILAYGYIGGMALIFMGFLLSIFMNSMSVWMAWKKYYRLQNKGNTEAIFFSIFKQRVIYQYINEYAKDEEGNTITNNYERGLYPQFDLEKLDKIAEELSPKYYELFSKKYPLYTKVDIQTYLK